jgi:hypothetical protein
MTAVTKVIQTPEQVAQDERRKQLEAELAAMGSKPKNINLQVTSFVDKKGVTKVGINIHGVTAKSMFVYASQALVLAQIAEELKAFVEEHRSALTWQK